MCSSDLVGWFTLACLMVNEARSILENLVECGYNVPEILIKGLEVADEMINKESGEDSNGIERNSKNDEQ